MTLEHYLILSAVLFCIGLLGVLTRRNAVVVLFSIEIMLNAANLNFIAFWRFGENPAVLDGPLFTLFTIAVAAAEVEGAADARTQGQCVGCGKVAYVDVVADAGAVGRGVIGAKQGKRFALAEGGL